MRKFILISVSFALFLVSCKQNEKNENMNNPLLNEFKTPYGVPPFDEINNEDFIPAAQVGMKLHEEEIAKLTANNDAPSFENTIVALETSGAVLDQVLTVFYNLNSSLTSDEIQKIAQDLSPELSAHTDAIKMNEDLFKRVKIVYDQKDELNLGAEDSMLLEETYKSFVRGGANLNEENKEKLRRINEELSTLSLRFGQNVLGEINDFKLIVSDEEEVSGLPENVKAAAAENAAGAGEEGKWLFTVQKPSLIPFLTYADNRDLREKLFKAYIMLGDNGNERDNKGVIQKIVKLRAEKAKLLGFATHADFILAENMARTPDKVFGFLQKVWDPALEVAKKEVVALQQMIDDEGKGFKLQAWDWWYYAEKLRKQKYDLDEETLSNYFVLENVRDGAFDVANKLYGLQFEKLSDIPVYHPDVQAFEVKDKNGSHVGILYMDFYPRASKRAGAWMSEYRAQHRENGKDIRPVVTTNFNFTKPVGDQPALLTSDEVLTTFHEFGHALHGLLSQTTYKSLSGTSVTRDFVELPSQIMENWAMEPEVLKSYAIHYQTGETIPEELIQKIQESRFFNQGFTTVEYLSAALLDMKYHTLTTGTADIDVTEFEKNTLTEAGLIPEIVVRYRSPYFSHVFSGGYSAGYYSYIWAEILDADAFQAFKESGNIFDPAIAAAFKMNVLEKGGTRDPMVLYETFRGKEPGIEPLLEKRGLN